MYFSHILLFTKFVGTTTVTSDLDSVFSIDHLCCISQLLCNHIVLLQDPLLCNHNCFSIVISRGNLFFDNLCKIQSSNRIKNFCLLRYTVLMSQKERLNPSNSNQYCLAEIRVIMDSNLVGGPSRITSNCPCVETVSPIESKQSVIF